MYKNFEIVLTKNYDNDKWDEDIMRLFRLGGVDNMPVVFLFNDTQLFQESILEQIVQLLNTGWIPNLFPMEIKAQIFEEMNA